MCVLMAYVFCSKSVSVIGALARCFARFLVLSTVSKGAILARRTENIVTLSNGSTN